MSLRHPVVIEQLTTRLCVGVVDAEGGVGYFANERGFSVESSLQGTSSNSLLWNRDDSWVVI